MSRGKKAVRGLSRREFVKGAAGAAAVAGAGVLAGCSAAEEEVAPTTVPAAPSAPWLPEKWDHEVDVVIVGYGGAGAVAAIEAYDNQANVLILDKMSQGRWNNVHVGWELCHPHETTQSRKSSRLSCRVW